MRYAILRAAVGIGLFVNGASACLAGEIGFVEDFALAKDRSIPLKQLVPGTEDYYYYICLHAQNTAKLDDADKLLKLWVERHNRTPKVIEIENRQALLRYEKSPKESLAFLQDRLGLSFNHPREILGEKPKLPTRLDEKLISRETLARRARDVNRNSLDGFQDSAFEWLIATDLSPEERRQLLHRLQRPDYTNLPKLVVDDLNFERSGGFGSHEIHRSLLLAQLEDCLKLKADLLNQPQFVETYLRRLRPGPDADWEHNPKEREAYLGRLRAFADRLNPSHNSLKAHVLYHSLVHSRSKGVYDKDLFTAYIALPRSVGYANPEYLRRDENRNVQANLQANFHDGTLLPPVGDDEPLVRSYLGHFFLTEDTAKPYETYLNSDYLKRVFAETKIVNGLGNMEQWYSMLTPEALQELKDRVEIEFDYANKVLFGADDPAALDLYVRNVKTLLVKVYEINTASYYRTHPREIDTSIDLDGLVANEEKTITYDEPALRRMKRHFDFPALKNHGVYIVDFIGNGRASRAVIRRGRLQHLVRTSTAGHVFTVLDEANHKVPDASLWLAGHQYLADKDGTIAVPFSTQPGKQTILLSQGDFACLGYFDHQGESYELRAGFYVDREALLARKKATVLVRPSLYLNGTPVTLAVLEDPTLVIRSTDLDGVSSSREIPAFKLFEDRESVQEFQVPDNLQHLQFTLKARVQNLSQNKKLDLQASDQFSLNGIVTTEKTEDVHLSHADGQYVLDVLGRTGEPIADRPIQVWLTHEDFKEPAEVTLQTDARGRIQLGPLPDITSVRANDSQGPDQRWPTERDWRAYPLDVHGRAGEVVRVPYMGKEARPVRSDLSLLEMRDGAFVTDRFDALALKDGFVEIGDVPAGNYELVLKNQNRLIRVRLAPGPLAEGHVLGENRLLEVRNPKPLQIAAVEADKDTVRIRLENATKYARVHVAAGRYEPAYDLYAHLAAPQSGLEGTTVPKTESFYVTGRDIGDEYRYVLERKYAKKYPGNMLQRPSLLLNPWAIAKAQTTKQEARAGEDFARRGAEKSPILLLPHRGGGRVESSVPFANLDFLSEPSAMLANLRPDEKGVVTIPRKNLGAHQQIRVLAVDPFNTVYREVSLPEVEMKFADLRLAAGLDPDKHFVEQKQTSVVRKGEDLVLADAALFTETAVETYDSLAKVHGLYMTLSQNPTVEAASSRFSTRQDAASTLAEFSFVLAWPKLKAEEKQEKYSRYACHELNFFLSRRDPEFFEKVIQPYLRNKKDKTFLDHWLLGDDLSGYLRPWAYGRLNIVERILLGQRVGAETLRAARHVADLCGLLPPDPERESFLFETALRGRALEMASTSALKKAQAQVEGERARLDEAGKWAANGKALEKARAEPAAQPAEAPAPGPRPSAPPPPSAKRAPSQDKSTLEAGELAIEELRDSDMERRKSVRALFRTLDTTQEWAENNYYHVLNEQQLAGLVTVNTFWRDYARHDGKGGFLSPHLAQASRSFAEMMFALAVLDLPFEAAEHKAETQGARVTLHAASPLVAYLKEIQPAPLAEEKVPVLVSQNFFRQNDRYRFVDNERLDKFVADEFLSQVVYGCQVVVTNPTSSPQKLDVLLQVPRGAIPVLNSRATRSRHLALQPYNTQSLEYHFYFPAPGKFAHYPVHVSKGGKLIAFCPPATLNVVEKPSKVDRASWDYISQNGTEDEVLAYLKEENLGRVALDRIAWRMQDAAFFRKALAVLDDRHVFAPTLWSYAIKHNELAPMREYLQHCDSFVGQCGAWLDSKPLTIDPVVRKAYQHLEYWPLVNARAHALGGRRKILSDRFAAQYARLMKVVCCRPDLDDADLMSVTCYMLLQDRVEEALGFFGRVQPDKLATRLQYDYAAAYLDFYSDAPKRARAIATPYAKHPIDRWRNLFANVVAQLDEVEGKAAQVVDKEDQAQQQARLAATEGSFDFAVEARKITVTYQNLAECRVNYYPMDIELLFSRNPFVQEYSERFSYVRPAAAETVKLDPAKTRHVFDLPERFATSNVMIEILAGGGKKARPYFSNTLAIQLIENYGQLRVTHAETSRPLPKVYIKVYARMDDGGVRFYKDGYTDLRGRFEYASLSTNDLDHVKDFSMLILSEAAGALVREAKPPKR